MVVAVCPQSCDKGKEPCYKAEDKVGRKEGSTLIEPDYICIHGDVLIRKISLVMPQKAQHVEGNTKLAFYNISNWSEYMG